MWTNWIWSAPLCGLVLVSFLIMAVHLGASPLNCTRCLPFEPALSSFHCSCCYDVVKLEQVRTRYCPSHWRSPSHPTHTWHSYCDRFFVSFGLTASPPTPGDARDFNIPSKYQNEISNIFRILGIMKISISYSSRIVGIMETLWFTCSYLLHLTFKLWKDFRPIFEYQGQVLRQCRCTFGKHATDAYLLTLAQRRFSALWLSFALVYF